MTDTRLILSTVSSADEARTIARSLVEKQLAACVNIVGPMQSIYRWKDGVEESQEFLLLIKSVADNVSRLRDEVARLNSYEVPECIVLGIESGLPAYLEWISESVKTS
jgi:periplasmic divalent cation tolerance protein